MIHFHLSALSVAIALSTSLHAQDATSSRRIPGGVNRPIQAAVQRAPLSSQSAMTAALPPLPEGVQELKFSEFYKLPVGPRGLEPSDKLRSLDGHRVRLTGFFVFEDWSTCSCPSGAPQPVAKANARPQRPQPAWMKHVVLGRIMLAPLPTSVSLGHYGLCDDLPPQVAYLELVSRLGEPVMYRPGQFSAIGTITLGTKEELDGRTSFVRVKIEREEDLVSLRPEPTASR